MSKIALGIAAAVVAVSSFAAPASAQYGRGQYSPYDFNRDGRVDSRENRQAQIDRSYDEYNPYDFNRDGRVDARENRQAQIDQGYGDHYYGYQQYSPYDLNRDGRVTRREMRLAQQGRRYR